MKTLHSIFAPLVAVLIITFAFTVFAPASAYTQFCGVSGYVYDNLGQPVPDVLITIVAKRGGTLAEVYTDYHGNYQAILRPQMAVEIYPYHDDYLFNPSANRWVPCIENQVTYVDAFIASPR